MYRQEQLDDEFPGHIPVDLTERHPLFKLIQREAEEHGLTAHMYGDGEGIFFSVDEAFADQV